MGLMPHLQLAGSPPTPPHLQLSCTAQSQQKAVGHLMRLTAPIGTEQLGEVVHCCHQVGGGPGAHHCRGGGGREGGGGEGEG